MKFISYHKAKKFAKSESRITGRKHIPVKTRYLSLDNYEFVNVWTVVLVPNNKKYY